MSFKIFCGTSIAPLFAPAFAINRGRCRFYARNTLHSRRRLLSLARKRCRPAVCATYFVQLYTRSFQMICGTATVPLFAPPSSLTAEYAASVRGKTLHSFRRLLTPARKQTMPLPCAECSAFIPEDYFARPQASDAASAVYATYFRASVHCLLIILRNGKQSAFCVRLRLRH